MAFVFAGFATLNAQTTTKSIMLARALSSYGPDGHGGMWTVNSVMKLGNYYEDPDNESYLQFNLYEFDFSAESIASINSITCKKIGDFRTPDNGEAEIPSDLAAFSIEIFAGGTGDARSDCNGSKLTSLAKFTGFSIKDFEDGSINLTGLDVDISGETYFTIAISVDKVLVPESASGGMGVEGNTTFMFTLTGTQAIPEPATYAAIFGALALGLAVYRRRK